MSEIERYKDLLQRAAQTIRKLEADQARDRNEPIAIVGLACRLPGGVSDAAGYWDLLKDGRDAIVRVPPDRWDADAWYDPDPGAEGKIITREGGFLSNIDGFDAGLFSMSPKEVDGTDPQHLQFLEVCWEALEDAGLDKDGLAGSATGVYVGINANDHGLKVAKSPDLINPYTGAADVASGAAGRVSYVFGFEGPAMAVDTACSSSLVTVHLAAQALRAGECDLALAGGVNLILSPEPSVYMSKVGALAPDGRCKTFDERADGIGRGEGAGVMVLKRLSDAERSGDPIHAVIKGSAVNQDGKSSGFTAPNPEAQKKVVRAALRSAGLTPQELQVIEAHGTGTVLGDRIELGSLGDVFVGCDVLVGSVKSNLGHLEAAAGIAGLIKVVLGLRHGFVPRSLHVAHPTGSFDWSGSGLRVARDGEAWPGEAGSRYGGVSSFGMSGTNAHVIVGDYVGVEAAPVRDDQRRAVIWPVSGMDGAAVASEAGRHLGWLEGHREDLVPGGYTASVGRSGLSQRGAAVGFDGSDIVAGLAALGADDAAALSGTVGTGVQRDGVVYLYPGQGAQFASMGLGLYEAEPLFRAAVDEAWSGFAAAYDELYGETFPEVRDLLGDGQRLGLTRWTQPALFAVSLGIARLLDGLGIRAAAHLGHSIGEYAAAVQAGVMSVADGARLVAVRGRLMGDLPLSSGAMASVRAGEAVVAEVIKDVAPDVSIAAVNGPEGIMEAVTISGPKAGVADVVTALEGKDIHCRHLDVSHGFHSAEMDGCLEAFRAVAETITYNRPTGGLISCRDGTWLEAVDADYWVRQLRDPVRFGSGLSRLYEAGYRQFAEIGPGSGLSALVRGFADVRAVAPLIQDEEERLGLARAVAAHWCGGGTVDWRAWYGDMCEGQESLPAKVRLPAYGFQRRRHWLEAPERSSGTTGLPVLRPVWTALGGSGTGGTRSWTVTGNGEIADSLKEFFTEGPEEQPSGNLYIAPSDLDAVAKDLADPARWLATDGPTIVLTQGARRVLGGDVTAPGAVQSAYWGFARTARREGLAVSIIDLDPGQDGTDELGASLMAALSYLEDHPGEEELALRGGGTSAGLYGLRLERAQGATAPTPPVDPEGTYLVTGGLGALGARLAAALQEAGAGRVVVTGRAEAGDIDPDRVPAGTEYRQLDPADKDAVNDLIAELGPALKGIAHMAGAGGFAPVLPEEGGDLRDLVNTSLEGKARGALHLHDASLDLKLDWFLLSGSVSGIWGSPGQAVYGAANQVLEGLAEHRRALGLPGLCINWGPWLGGGMTSTDQLAAMARIGLKGLEPGTGQDLVNGLLGTGIAGTASPVVAELDWPVFLGAVEARGSRALFDRLRETPVHTAADQMQGDAVIATAVTAALAGQRRDVMEQEVGKIAAAVLGFADSDDGVPLERGLFELGLDSLMAVEMARRLTAGLGQEVPATIVFDGGTVRGIAARLLERMDLGDEDTSTSTSTPATARAAPVSDDAVAVIGLSCRFPMGDTDNDTDTGGRAADLFYEALLAGLDGVRPAEDWRWDKSRYVAPEGEDIPGRMGTDRGGYIEAPKGFDTDLFGISPREAARLDPQHRLVLEVCWEALERSGIAPDGLKNTHTGARTGVHVGISNGDYGQLLLEQGALSDLGLHHATGNALSAAAGRVSHILGLGGPALSVDTACSSSLVSVHLARRALLAGEADLMLAGGVNMLLSPTVTVAASGAGMLSPDGLCKTFDERADGYVRGEGCGMVVLKRLSDAERDGDRVLAVLLGSAVNHNGPGAGLTVPSGAAQERLLRDVLGEAGLEGRDVDVLEAHGTGTSLGDPIELGAAAAVYCADDKETARTAPLLAGSVKTNIGHLESAAGIAGLIKLIQSIRHGRLPGHLHYDKANPRIDGLGSRDGAPAIEVATGPRDWSPGDKRRIGGVSSFGFTGTNAHILIAEPEGPAETSPVETTEEQSTDQAYPVLLSGRDRAALIASASRLAAWLEGPGKSEELGPVLRDLAVSHAALPVRAGFTVEANEAGRKNLIARLRALGQDDGTETINETGASGAQSSTVWLFTGQGSQWSGMARDLYHLPYGPGPVFKDIIDRAAELLQEISEESDNSPWQHDLRDVMFEEQEPALLDRTEWTQVSLYALQWGLCTVLKDWGLSPSLVAGHSVGEIAAAAAAGMHSFEDGLRLAAARARLMGALPTTGPAATGMISAAASPERVKDILGPLLDADGDEDTVEIATVNAPEALTLAGTHAALSQAEARLNEAGIETRTLSVSHGFHSRAMEPMLKPFQQAIAGLPTATPRIPLIEGTEGQLKTATHSPEDWAAAIRKPVRFDRVFNTLSQEAANNATLIEIGPKAVLSALAALNGMSQTAIPAITPKANIQALAAELYQNAITTNTKALFRSIANTNTPTPTYPFNNTTEHWALGERKSNRAALGSIGQEGHPLLGERFALPGSPETRFVARQSGARPSYLDDHRLFGTIVTPAASHISMILSANQALNADGPCRISNLAFPKALVLADEEAETVHLVINGTSVQILSGDGQDAVCHLSGEYDLMDARTDGGENWDDVTGRFDLSQPPGDPYPQFEELGYTLGQRFKWIDGLWSGDGEAVARLACADDSEDASPYVLHAGLIDSTFQTLCGCFPDGVAALADPDHIFIPFSIEAVEFNGSGKPVHWCHVRARGADAGPGGERRADITLFSEDGDVAAVITGFAGRKAPKDKLLEAIAPEDAAEWAEKVVWEETDAPEKSQATGTWLVAGDNGDAEAFADGIRAAAADLVTFGWSDDPGGLPAQAGRIAVFPGSDPAFETLPKVFDLLGRVESARVSIFTRSGAIVTPADVLEGEETAAGYGGLAATLCLERPNTKVRVADFVADEADVTGKAIAVASADELSAFTAYRAGTWYARKIAPARDSVAAETSHVLQSGVSGDFSTLHFAETIIAEPGPGEVRIAVEATGLNFRDVMTAMNMFPGEAQPLGGEVAGRVDAVGPGVTDLKPGDPVVGLCFGRTGFAAHVNAEAGLMVKRPDGVGPDDAIGLAVTMLTAVYGLRNLAGLKAGETVLIHTGTGGVGLAAIALAQSVGAEIVTTAGSDEKREYLKELGVRCVADSRSTDFAAHVQAELGERPVDVVLNTLSGQMVDASFGLLKEGGRFVELGKREVWSAEEAGGRRPDVAFHHFDLVQLSRDEPAMIREILAETMRNLAAGTWPALPVKSFGADHIADAFQEMARARHIGKIAARLTPRFRPRADGAYLITGGLGGLGLALGDALARDGAGCLILMSRRTPDAAQQARIEALAENGTEVIVHQGSVSDRDGLRALRDRLDSDGTNLRGVFHAAAHLDDAMIGDQTAERIMAVLEPKTDGVQALGEMFAGPGLETFVLFSSATAVAGSMGQSAYSAANAAMDLTAHKLRARGIPAIAIGWGPWAEIGMAARLNEADKERMRRRGYEGIPTARGLDLLFRLIHADVPHLVAVRKSKQSAAGRAANVLDAKAPVFASPDDLKERLPKIVGKILGGDHKGGIDQKRPFKDMGFDSLMSVELRNALSQALGRPLPATLIFDYPSMDALTDHLIGLLEQGDGETPEELPLPEPANEGGADPELDAMDEDELAALLDAKLEGLDDKLADDGSD